MLILNLIDVVEDVLDSERLSIGEFKMFFETDVPEGFEIRADPEQMYRVLGNLIRNARQAIMASGSSGTICIGAKDGDAAWEISLRDSGPGLPLKAQEHLFSPFQGSVRKGGSGLGLAISAELVRGHGGDIRLVRTDQDGTEFLITLPKGDGTI